MINLIYNKDYILFKKNIILICIVSGKLFDFLPGPFI